MSYLDRIADAAEYGERQTEADFQEAVLDLARLCGWTVAHFRPARVGTGNQQRWVTPVAADGKGFPDLVMVHPRHGVLFRELKSKTGRLSASQKQWLETLDAAGADAAVWRPADWDDVEDTLRGAA